MSLNDVRELPVYLRRYYMRLESEIIEAQNKEFENVGKDNKSKRLIERPRVNN